MTRPSRPLDHVLALIELGGWVPLSRENADWLSGQPGLRIEKSVFWKPWVLIDWVSHQHRPHTKYRARKES